MPIKELLFRNSDIPQTLNVQPVYIYSLRSQQNPNFFCGGGGGGGQLHTGQKFELPTTKTAAIPLLPHSYGLLVTVEMGSTILFLRILTTNKLFQSGAANYLLIYPLLMRSTCYSHMFKFFKAIILELLKVIVTCRPKLKTRVPWFYLLQMQQ